MICGGVGIASPHTAQETKGRTLVHVVVAPAAAVLLENVIIMRHACG